MARMRSIKPELFRSLTVSGWAVGVRWTFAGLLTYLDDEGRGIDDPRLIKAEVYPLDDDMTARKVSGHLTTITESGPLCRYEVDGRRYLHVTSWAEHQRINRPTRSRIPPCPVHEGSVPPHGVLSEPSVSEQGGVTEGSRSHAQAGAPAEHGSRELGSEGTREANAANGTRPPRSPGQRRAEDLNATSRRPDTQRLLNAWEVQRGAGLLPDARRQWNRAVDQVLDQGATQADVAGALPVLAARGLGPSLLASVIEEQRDKRANRPIHERGPDEVTDAELTRAVLDDLLGEDSWMPPPCPDDIEQGPPGPRRAWFAARRDERLAERRAEARQVLARNQAVTT